MGWSDPNLEEIYRRDFNIAHVVTGDWGHTEAKRGVRDWSGFDYASGRVGKFVPVLFKGSILDPSAQAPPNGLPLWLWDLSRSEAIAEMTDFVTEGITRARGKVWAFTVCGETNHARDALHDIIGPEYVDMAYAAARKAVPEMPLCYLDYDNQAKLLQRYSITKDIVDRLKRQKLLDLVGLEGWMYAGSTEKGGLWPWTKGELIDALQSYGLPIVFTEFAVLMGDIKGTQDYRYGVEAGLYRMALEAAIESGVCNHFILSGPMDSLSFWGNAPFDDQLRPKPSYYALQSVLQEAVGRKFPYRRAMPLVWSDR